MAHGSCRSSRFVSRGLLLGSLAFLLAMTAATAPASAQCLSTGRACGINSAVNDRLCCPGTVCGWGNVCFAGCRIAGVVVPAGTPDPENPCRACLPRTSTTRWSPVAYGSCDDGNRCTTRDACRSGQCAGTPLTCDDNDPCTIDACSSAIGCVSRPKNCSDNNVCTIDSCNPRGVCVNTPIVGCRDPV